MANPTLSVIILAGGRSQRMGTDKALLKTPNGKPLIARTIQLASQLAEDVVVVTGWGDRYQPLLHTQSPPLKVRFIPEQTAEGPLNGFAQGLGQVRSEWCLLLACDLPYLAPEPLQKWWNWLIQTQIASRPMASLVPKLQGPRDQIISSAAVKYWEPLCGFYHRSCQLALAHHLNFSDNASSTRRQRSFQSWLSSIPIAAYTALPQTMLFNCNTPEDWAIAQSHIF